MLSKHLAPLSGLSTCVEIGHRSWGGAHTLLFHTDLLLHCYLMTYCYIHRLVHFSVLIGEAWVCSRWWWTQRPRTGHCIEHKGFSAINGTSLSHLLFPRFGNYKDCKTPNLCSMGLSTSSLRVEGPQIPESDINGTVWGEGEKDFCISGAGSVTSRPCGTVSGNPCRWVLLG